MLSQPRFATMRRMSGLTPRPRPAMSLREVVGKYLALAGGYGNPASLASFGISRSEIERVFGLYDEDYHISRYFHFTNGSGEAYQINGFPQTHVSIDAEIEAIL